MKTTKLALLALAAMLTSVAAEAATSATVTHGQWDLYRSDTNALISSHSSETACVDKAKSLGVTRNYTCRTRTSVAVTVTTGDTCGARPADESRTQSCPSGTTGTWTQTRTYTSAAYPTCWTAGSWTPGSAPSGYCTPDTGGGSGGSGQVITVSSGQSISNAVSQLQPGGTVVIKPGTYSAFSLKACSSSAWCTIKAETDGTVNVTGLNIGNGNWYTKLEGLKFSGSSVKTITGNYLKFMRTAFEGGPTSGNNVSVQIGTNNRTPGASNVLLEDSWVYGRGGRYKVLVYNAEKIVLRRVVVRHDGGWSYDGSNPQGGFSLYDSKDVACQDCMFLDPASSLSGFEAGLYLVSNSTTGQRQSNVSVNGAIIMGSQNNGLAAEGDGAAATYSLSNVVIHNSGGGVATNNSSHVVNLTGAYVNTRGTAYARWADGGSLTVKNCISSNSRTVSDSASLSNCSTNPTSSQGLKFPVRVEAGSSLANAKIGPDVTKKVGVSGTLFGESGYDAVLADSLWPYPNEARIKSDFDSVRAAFGGKSLTDYVWEQLGNTSPY